MINMNTAVMHDSPIAFPGLFGDWTFTASSKAINIGGGVYVNISAPPRFLWSAKSARARQQ